MGAGVGWGGLRCNTDGAGWNRSQWRGLGVEGELEKGRGV